MRNVRSSASPEPSLVRCSGMEASRMAGRSPTSSVTAAPPAVEASIPPIAGGRGGSDESRRADYGTIAANVRSTRDSVRRSVNPRLVEQRPQDDVALVVPEPGRDDLPTEGHDDRHEW